jgi:hypothetical protein
MNTVIHKKARNDRKIVSNKLNQLGLKKITTVDVKKGYLLISGSNVCFSFLDFEINIHVPYQCTFLYAQLIHLIKTCLRLECGRSTVVIFQVE